jgi:NitT/TauT family transport system substrate-binding protein
MRKKLVIMVFFLCIISGFLHARGRNENRNLTIYGLRGSPGVAIIRLFEEPPQISGFNVRVEALAQADLMAARFIAGEIQAGLLPPNMAAKIASSGRDIRVGAVIGQGMFSLLSSDPNVRRIEDLRGKTVQMAGQGATPDYVFRKILHAHGLTPDVDVILNYSLAHHEIAPSLITGRISYALLPEPFATMARSGKPDLIQVSDIQEEWAKLGSSENYPITVLVFDGAFASANPSAVEEILRSVKVSIEWVKNNPAEAGVLAEKHEIGFRAAIVAASIPRSNYVFIRAAEARPSIEALFRVFLENAPVSIGGVLPRDEFYLK